MYIVHFNSVDVNGEAHFSTRRCSFLERLNLLSERDAIISILSPFQIAFLKENEKIHGTQN